MGAWYAWREDVRAATDSKTTARDNRLIDRAIEAGTEAVKGLLHRTFEPITATRLFDWPNLQYARPWRLWLDANEVVEVTELRSGGAVIAPTDYFLEPHRYGPPYDRIELDLDGPASFGGGSTHQRDISITGVWAGAQVTEVQAGQLTAPLGASGSAGIQLDASTGVGAVLRIDAERMIVTDKVMVDTAQNLQAGLASSAADVTVQVSNGAEFDYDQVLLVDAERMLVVDIAANNLIVKRAWDGSVLQAHSSGADVFSLSGFTVARGQLGTAAAAHLSAAPIFVWQPPTLVRELCIAEAIAELQQHGAGWGRTVGSGENEREARGVGLADIRKRCRTAHGRQARMRAV